jgi:hypothetical protein
MESQLHYGIHGGGQMGNTLENGKHTLSRFQWSTLGGRIAEMIHLEKPVRITSSHNLRKSTGFEFSYI